MPPTREPTTFQPGTPEAHPRRRAMHGVIFGTDTPAGRGFDIVLIALILVSVVTVSLDTVGGLPAPVRRSVRSLEWVLTALFTIEYGLRLAAVRRPLAYAASFYGIVDLLAILPTYLSVLLPGTQALLVVRILRLLRVFRVLKLSHFVREASTLSLALRASARKIAVFLFTVAMLIVVMGSVMYVVEGPANGFTSIPTSMYWTVVTLTTVGYGDISPRTPLGQTLASLLMVLGYGIIAVPTGIVTAELAHSGRGDAAASARACPACGATEHGRDAGFCWRCGASLGA